MQEGRKAQKLSIFFQIRLTLDFGLCIYNKILWHR